MKWEENKNKIIREKERIEQEKKRKAEEKEREEMRQILERQ